MAATSVAQAQDLPDGDSDPVLVPKVRVPPLDEATGGVRSKKVRRLKRKIGKGTRPGAAKRQEEQRFWRDISYGLPNIPFTAVAAHPVDPDVYFVGADGFVFKTDDGGESWRAVLSFSPGISDDGITSNQSSFDNIANSDAAVGLDKTQGVDFSDGEDVADFEEEGVVEEVADLPDGDFDAAAGVGEVLFPRQGPGVRDIHIVGRGVIYAATPRGLFRSIDNGENWKSLLLPGGPAVADIRAITADPRKPSVLFVGSADGLWLTPDGGSTVWRAEGRVGRTPILDVATERLGAETVTVVGTEQGLFRAWKTGETFKQVLLEGEGPFDPVTAVAFDPRDAVTYAGTPNGLYASERKSAVLEPRSVFSNVFATALLMNPTELRALAVGARDDGVVFATATGLERTVQSAPLQVLQVTGLARRAKDAGSLIAATERGIFIRDKGTGMTVSRDVMRELRARWAKEPSLREVALRAIEIAGVDPQDWSGMQKRARWAALLPRASANYRFLTGRISANAYVIDPEVLFDPTIDPNDPQSVEQLVATDAILNPTVRGDQHRFTAFLIWQPERLLFNDRILPMIRQRPLQHKMEQRIVNTVQTAFTARRRLMAEIASDADAGSASLLIARTIRMQELTAILDGATNGAFSEEAIAHGVVDPSAPIAAPKRARPQASNVSRKRGRR